MSRGDDFCTEQEMRRFDLHHPENAHRVGDCVLNENPKDVAGRCKPPLYLIPPVANIWECLVLQYGSTSHPAGPRGEFNWRTGPQISMKQYIGALERHIAALKDGEDNDPSSGLPHLAHIRATAGIMLDADSIEQMKDDRPPPGNAAALIAQFTKPLEDSSEVE